MIEQPVFPSPQPAEPGVTPDKGLTIRDYFAGAALLGIQMNTRDPAEIAQLAYRIADAMLIEREPPAVVQQLPAEPLPTEPQP